MGFTLISTFNIEGIVWQILYRDAYSDYIVNKDGDFWENGNGSPFETETEAEINILNEYREQGE